MFGRKCFRFYWKWTQSEGDLIEMKNSYAHFSNTLEKGGHVKGLTRRESSNPES